MRTIKNRNTYLRNKTNKQKKENKKIYGRLLSNNNGWKTIEIYGSPFHRGFAHGSLLFDEMEKNMKSFSYLVNKDFKVTMEEYIDTCNEKIKPIIIKDFPELYEELQGITAGFNSEGLFITIEYLIAWNSFLSMYDYYNCNQHKNTPNRCSAFIATGEATEKGDIVMAHNTHSYLYIFELQNIIIYIKPEKGYPFVMQTVSGYIASGTDWFICSTGIIGCETTISNINYKPEFGSPYFCRIRQSMQYGKTLDDYSEIMLKNNAGDYACSWLFGDINTNEIMLFELGLKTHSIQKTKNGVYYGMNSLLNNTMRLKETSDTDLYIIEKSSGSRNVRLNYLLNDKYYGKINIVHSKEILSDHYDEYLHKNIKNKRCICKHGEINNPHNVLSGCTDGKVVNTDMAKKMRFMGRFGSSCGRVFKVDSFMKKNPEYKNQKEYLIDIPKYNWVEINNKEKVNRKN